MSTLPEEPGDRKPAWVPKAQMQIRLYPPIFSGKVTPQPTQCARQCGKGIYVHSGICLEEEKEKRKHCLSSALTQGENHVRQRQTTLEKNGHRQDSEFLRRQNPQWSMSTGTYANLHDQETLLEQVWCWKEWCLSLCVCVCGTDAHTHWQTCTSAVLLEASQVSPNEAE